MKLNWVETLVVNNPLRRWHQVHVEARILEDLLAKSFAGGRVLVAGCGRGVEIELAFRRFGAASVDAFDLDPKQVRRARQRLGHRFGVQAGLWVGDATRIPVRAARYDAVLDWGVLHHIADWKAAIREIARVLVVGGQLLFIEVPGHKIRSPHYRLLFDHPLEEDRKSVV